jgi:hypothetical protein
LRLLDHFNLKLYFRGKPELFKPRRWLVALRGLLEDKAIV